jgi:hypothetical protein
MHCSSRRKETPIDSMFGEQRLTRVSLRRLLRGMWGDELRDQVRGVTSCEIRYRCVEVGAVIN